MGNTIKRLGDAEREIMQIIWECYRDTQEAVTAGYVLERLQNHRKWALSTLMTVLSRLTNKGFLSCDRTYRNNLYIPLISEEDYRASESRNFLDKLYGNSFQRMVASFYDSRIINQCDLKELRSFLDELEKGEKEP